MFLTRFRTYKIASIPQTKMTSKDDIKGLVSLKFLRPWIGLIEGKCKMSSCKKIIDLYRNYATGVYLSEAQNPTAPPYTLYTCIQYSYSVFTQGWVEGGDFNQREGERGQQFTKRVKNTNTTDCISSL
jgi:hypothetical protein